MVASAQAPRNNDSETGPAIRTVLLTGMALSAAAIAFGAVLAVAKGQWAGESVKLIGVPSGIRRLNGAAFIDLGVAMLILTPLAGILAAVVAFRGKRTRDSMIGLLILAMLAASFAATWLFRK